MTGGRTRPHSGLTGHELWSALRDAVRVFAALSAGDAAQSGIARGHTREWEQAGAHVDGLLREVNLRLDGAPWGRPGGTVHQAVEVAQESLGDDEGPLPSLPRFSGEPRHGYHP